MTNDKRLDKIIETLEGGSVMPQTTKEIHEVHYRSIKEDLVEWNELLTWLSKSNRRLAEIKNEYVVKSEKLLAEARKVKEDEDIDIIKNLYGGNNDKTRKQYVKDTLKSLTDEENELKRYTAEDGRRIAFLKELIRYKRLALEVENE